MLLLVSLYSKEIGVWIVLMFYLQDIYTKNEVLYQAIQEAKS